MFGKVLREVIVMLRRKNGTERFDLGEGKEIKDIGKRKIRKVEFRKRVR